MNGYILESRTILDSAIWKKPPLYFKVWHYLLMNAQHSDYKTLRRGQLFTSIDQIRTSCSYYVGYRKVTPTRKEIYGVLEWLRNPHEGNNEGNNESPMIVTTKVTHGMIVTIVNYGLYQDPKFYEGNNEGRPKVTTKEQRRSSEGNNKNKNVKNDNNKNEVFLGADAQKKIPPEFDEVKAYVRSKGYKMEVTEFMTYYEMRGWTLTNGRKITDWRAAVDYWASKSRKDSKADTPPMPYFREVSETAPVIGTEAPYEGGVVAELIRRKRAKNA